MFMCDGLTFGYRDLLFESCCATVAQPRVGITGRNGSGKTTLLRLLDGQLKPQSGEVVVEGSTYLVDFDFERYSRFTARDIVALCEPLESFDATKADELAEGLQFSDYLDVPIGELSKGSAKKVGLIMGFMSTAHLLLLDEPFESIDSESNDAIIRILREMDRPVLIVSHDHDRLVRTVDALYEIRNRKLERL